MNRALILIGLFLLVVTISNGCQTPASQWNHRPKLAVVVVVDQMRADHLSRFAGLYRNGFGRLLREGAVFTNAHHIHARTATGPGHASISTGCYPAHHGIVGNRWYDRIEKRFVYCVEDSTYPLVGYPDQAAREGRAPSRMLTPALGDWLKEQSPKSKVFAVARKDRSAIASAGIKGDAAYWYNMTDETMITSEYYMKSYPRWVEKFNNSAFKDQLFQKSWQKLMPEETYFLAREDAFPMEYDGQKTAFPHTIEREIKPDERFQLTLADTPFADALILEFAKELIVNEDMGKDDPPDILFIGCSSADAIGHTFGPFSQESLDHFLRLDNYLSQFFTFLDQNVGVDNYITVLSSDHGVMAMPEELARRGFAATRIFRPQLIGDIKKVFSKVSEELNITEPLLLEPVHPELGPRPYSNHQLLVNYGAAEVKGVGATKLDSMLVRYLKQVEFVEDVLTKDQIVENSKNDRTYADMYRNTYHADRCGDLFIRLKKFALLRRYGTSHGSPYPYDTHVPIVVSGKGIPKGFHSQKVRTIDIAPTLAECFGIKPPVEIDGRSLLSAIDVK